MLRCRQCAARFSHPGAVRTEEDGVKGNEKERKESLGSNVIFELMRGVLRTKDVGAGECEKIPTS